jgi:membrane protease YdiL (CAAX protease family)
MTVLALVLALVVLVAANLLDNRFAPSSAWLTTVVAVVLLLGLAKLGGLSWADVGLGEWASGLRWGLAAVLVIALGYLVAALVPATREFLVDHRSADASPGDVAFQTLVRIPFATVLLEELAFRGVLFGLLQHLFGTGWATVLSSLLFGLWHVLSAGALPRENPSAGRLFAGHPALVVPATVLVTALAGIVLSALRVRSGSLLAPFLAHWALNALGYLTSYLVTRRSGEATVPEQ